MYVYAYVCVRESVVLYCVCVSVRGTMILRMRRRGSGRGGWGSNGASRVTGGMGVGGEDECGDECVEACEDEFEDVR